jgi:hypothetical protein
MNKLPNTAHAPNKDAMSTIWSRRLAFRSEIVTADPAHALPGVMVATAGAPGGSAVLPWEAEYVCG